MLNHGKQPDAGRWRSQPRGISQVYDGASRLAVPAACSSADDLMMIMAAYILVPILYRLYMTSRKRRDKLRLAGDGRGERE